MGEISTEVLEEENDGLYGDYKGQQKRFPSKEEKNLRGLSFRPNSYIIHYDF